MKMNVLLHAGDAGAGGTATGLPGIDVKSGLFVMGGNTSLYARMLKKFTENVLYADLQTALQGGDSEDIQAKAHALKGVAANLSLHPLFELVQAIDSTAKSGTAISLDDPRIGELDREYQLVLNSAKAVAENPALLKI